MTMYHNTKSAHKRFEGSEVTILWHMIARTVDRRTDRRTSDSKILPLTSLIIMEFKLVSRQDDAELKRIGTLFMSVAQLVSWCFEPSQPQRITSGLNTNFTISPSYSIHKSSYHKTCFFLSLFIFWRYSTRKPASGRVSYFILQACTGTMCLPQPTQEHWERFGKKCRWTDRTGNNKRERNPWQ